MLDLVLLRTFVAVSETGSFTRAARELGISQSTVSDHVRRLEAVARRELVHRDTRTVARTTHGDTMLAFARSILDAHDEAEAYFTAPAFSGRLRLGAENQYAGARLVEVLDAIRGSHPEIDLELSCDESSALIRQVRTGHLDLAVVPVMIEGPDIETLVEDRFVWMGSPALRLDPEEPVPIVVLTARHPADVAIGLFEGQGRSCRVTCEARDAATLMAAVRAGLGLSPMPSSFVPDDLVGVESPLLPAFPVDTWISLVVGRRVRPEVLAVATTIKRWFGVQQPSLR